MTEYLVVIEKTDGNFGAYIPDLPGCVSTGDTVEEVRKLMQEAIQMHIESLREHGEPVPPPSSSAEYLAV
jgi:predicted RNase H-like HicB family nuclease